MTLVVRRVRQIIVFCLGFTIVIIGAIMVPLPGPGLLIMLLGLMLLSTEFAWARAHTDRLKQYLRRAVARARGAVRPN